MFSLIFILCAPITTALRLRPYMHGSSSNSNGWSARPNTLDLLDVINAIGGQNVLDRVKTFEYHANDVYRSSTLTQTYTLYSLDQTVASAGSQNMSFAMDNSSLKLRIDRAYNYNEYWTWAFPDLKPSVNMSVVVQDTEEPYACFVQGQNSFFSSNLSIAQGYADSLLTDYLIHQARQFALPWLLLKFLAENSMLKRYQVSDTFTSTNYTAIEHPELGLSILADQHTHLPHAIRSVEQHSVYGQSTSDLILTAYSNVSVEDDMISLPHRFQTVYNSRFVLEDFLVDGISINSNHSESFFEGRALPEDPEEPSSGSNARPSKPQQSSEYPRSEVHEFYEAGLWGGPFGETFNVSHVVVEYPYPESKNIMRIYIGYLDYVQLLVEHENGFIITDAPPHRSEIILDWLRINRPGKNITHVVPSHHHRDHAGGVYDYIDAGATLVIPEIAKDFYNQSGQHLKSETYGRTNPFIFKDNLIEFRSFWKTQSPHAEDWTFAVAMKSQPTDDDPFVVFNADVINPGTDALRWDTGAAREFMIAAVEVGIPRSTLLIGSHGSANNGTSTSEDLASLADIIGFSYPALASEDWVNAFTSHSSQAKLTD